MSGLIKKRGYRDKPTRFLFPNLNHPQLEGCHTWWPFVDGAGPTLVDVYGRAPGSIVGAKWTAKAALECLDFGTKSNEWFVDFDDDNFPSGIRPRSQSMWLYTIDNSQYGMFFSVGSDASDRGWTGEIGRGLNGRLTVNVQGSVVSETGGSIVTGRWQHVVLGYTGSHVRAYVDGVLVIDTSKGINTQPSNNASIGRRKFASPFPYPGFMQDIRCYDRMLSDAEVFALYHDPWAPWERRIWVPTEAAPPGPITGTGALQAQSAAVVGVGEVISPTIITGTGALQTQDATVSGVGDVISPAVGTGTLQAQNAQVSGVGAVVHDGSGTLQAQPSTVIGVGEVGNVRTGAGALQAGEAAVVGTGVRVSVGSGVLQAQDAAVSGVGVVEGLTAGTGVLQAQNTAVTGTGHLVRVGSGALQAQPAQVAGVGAILGELTLSPADIAAIADAVYAKLVSEGLVQQINEVWQRRGLDPANPQTYDKAGNEIRVGNITIDLSGDPSSVTQTRQP